MNGWVVCWIGGWVDEWMGWVGAWLGGWVDRLLANAPTGNAGNMLPSTANSSSFLRNKQTHVTLVGGWVGWVDASVGGWVDRLLANAPAGNSGNMLPSTSNSSSFMGNNKHTLHWRVGG